MLKVRIPSSLEAIDVHIANYLCQESTVCKKAYMAYMHTYNLVDFDGMYIAEHANGTRTSGLDTGIRSSGIEL